LWYASAAGNFRSREEGGRQGLPADSRSILSAGEGGKEIGVVVYRSGGKRQLAGDQKKNGVAGTVGSQGDSAGWRKTNLALALWDGSRTTSLQNKRESVQGKCQIFLLAKLQG